MRRRGLDAVDGGVVVGRRDHRLVGRRRAREHDGGGHVGRRRRRRGAAPAPHPLVVGQADRDRVGCSRSRRASPRARRSILRRRSTRWPVEPRARLTRWGSAVAVVPVGRSRPPRAARQPDDRDGRRDASVRRVVGAQATRPTPLAVRDAEHAADEARRRTSRRAAEGARPAARARGPLHDVGTARRRHERREERRCAMRRHSSGIRTRRPLTMAAGAPGGHRASQRHAVRVHPRRPEAKPSRARRRARPTACERSRRRIGPRSLP